MPHLDQHSMNQGARRPDALWIAIFVVTVATLIAIAEHMRLAPRRAIPVYSLALLERNWPYPEMTNRQNAAAFEAIHRLALEGLIADFNRRENRYQLRLLPPDEAMDASKPLDEIAFQEYLTARYERLKGVSNLVAVMDNCWGKDILPRAESFKTFPVPVVFLNADHNQTNFGPGRLFVGSADQVPDEISIVLEKLVEDGRTNVVFVTEARYPLRARYAALLATNNITEVRKAPFRQVATVELPDYLAGDTNEIERARTSISYAVQSVPKPLILLNVHAQWGSALINWLDQNFNDIEVVGYQAILSRSMKVSFGEGENELIVLSSSNQQIPESLDLRMRGLRKSHPQIFEAAAAVFYVRRCVVGLGATVSALQTNVFDAKDDLARRSLLLSNVAGFANGKFRTSLGEHRFSNGELLGQNHFIKYKRHEMAPAAWQVIYRGNAPVSVRSIQAGLRDVHIQSIDIQNQSLHARFQYWFRYEGNMVDGKLTNIPGVLLPIDFKPDTLEDPSIGSQGQRLLATKARNSSGLRAYQVSGTFNIPIDGGRYPFDRHRLKIELQAPVPDNELRMSRQDFGDEKIECEGWTVGDRYLALNNRESNPVPVGDKAFEGDDSQHDILTFTAEVRRELWTPILLIVSPLFLLTLASLAVLYIKFPGDNGLQAEDSGASLETQTGLSADAVLAVIAYLISYASLAPRLQRVVYSDLLIGFTLAVAVANYIFIVAFLNRTSNWLFAWLTLRRYRRIATVIAFGGFVLWFYAGWSDTFLWRDGKMASHMIVP